MLTVENEHFIRLLLLIVKAGTSVLRLVFKKKLDDSRLQLSVFLSVNKDQIDKLKEGKVLTLKQYNVLFPSNGKTTDFGNYDISLLSCLLVNIFRKTITKPEVNAIEQIKQLRNVFQAHHTNGSIDRDTFFRKWNELRTSINTLGHGLTSEQCLNLEEVIKSVSEDNIDTKCAIQIIKDANDKIDHFIEHVSQQLEQLSPLLQQIKDRDMEIKELKQENRIIIGEVSITSKNPKAALGAAKILMDEAEKWKKSNAESRDTEATVNAFFQGITDAGGEIVDITQGSVLLHIRCHSVLVVSRVVNYFKSSEIELRLNDIEKYLTELVEADVNLSAIIQPESLQKVQRYLEQEESQEYTTQVRFGIKCHNSDGVLNVVKLMESEETTSKMSAISNDLSKQVGCPVTLTSSVDKNPLQQFIVEKVDKRGDKEDEAEIEKGAVETIRPKGRIGNQRFKREITDDRSDVAPTKTKAFQPMMHTEKGKEWLEKRHKRFIEERGDEPIVLRKEREREAKIESYMAGGFQRKKELEEQQKAFARKSKTEMERFEPYPRRLELEDDIPTQRQLGKQIETEMKKNQRHEELDKRRWELEAAVDQLGVKKQLQNIPGKLEAISLQKESDIRQELLRVISEAKYVVNTFCKAMTNEGNAVLRNKSALVGVLIPREVKVYKFKDSLTSLQRALKQARHCSHKLEEHVGELIEKCQAGARENQEDARTSENRACNREKDARAFNWEAEGPLYRGLTFGAISLFTASLFTGNILGGALFGAVSAVILGRRKYNAEEFNENIFVQIDSLNEVMNKLREIKEQLCKAVSVIDNLTVNVQNLNSMFDDAEKYGNPCRIIQNSLFINPEKMERKALDYVRKLKDVWLCVEEDLVKNGDCYL